MPKAKKKAKKKQSKPTRTCELTLTELAKHAGLQRIKLPVNPTKIMNHALTKTSFTVADAGNLTRIAEALEGIEQTLETIQRTM